MAARWPSEGVLFSRVEHLDAPKICSMNIYCSPVEEGQAETGKGRDKDKDKDKDKDRYSWIHIYSVRRLTDGI